MSKTEKEASRTISAQRRHLVEAAQQKWVRLLIDLSRRNTLLYFKHWKLASAELTDWDQDALQMLLAGHAVPLVDLLPNDKDVARRGEPQEEAGAVYTEEGAEDGDDGLSDRHLGLLPKLKAIARKAQENFEERGMETMYLAYGMATWKADDGGRNPEAAVLLLPVTVEGTGRRRSLVPRGDLETNIALLYRLEQLGADDFTDQLEEAIGDDDEVESGEAHEAAFAMVLKSCSHLPGFELNERLVVGNFSFEKLAMVKDLEANSEALAESDIVAALAGDLEAAADLRSEWEDSQLDPDQLDALPTPQEYLVAPADSSQQAALVMVSRGQSGVISGPPGTGKSQTITNLIANLVAEGKSVLFVAQKRAALEVVKRRLDAVGLGHLVLDLHGQTKKAEVMRQFAESYERIRGSSAVDSAALDSHFQERRQQLNDHVERMHRKRAPSGLSAYELQAEILGAPEDVRSDVRWDGPELERLTAEEAHRLEGLLEEAVGLAELFLRDPDAAWEGAQLVTPAHVTTALGCLDRILRGQFDELRRAADAFGADTHLPVATLTDIRLAAQLGANAQALLFLYPPSAFELDLVATSVALQPASSALRRIWASAFNSSYRAARDIVRRLRSAPVGDATLLQDLRTLSEVAGSWSALSGGASKPSAPPSLAPLASSLSAFESSWLPLRELLGWGEVEAEMTDDLREWLGALDDERDDAYRLPRLCAIEAGLGEGGLQPLVEDLRDRNPDSATWVVAFRYAYQQSCLQAAWLEDPELAAFDGRHHSQVVEDFRSLDGRRTEIAAARVRHAHARKAVAIRNAYGQQEALVRAEAKKKTRHKTVRALIAEAPDVVTALRPCWMASPLSVSQLLAGDARYFDVVIFDEASQVLPEDAVTSILRGTTIVVAGDEKQLPPTPFFASGTEESEESREEAEAVEGYESVLEIMGKVFDPWDLTWHYRSQDERLIAFSNRHIYNERLITFPGVGLVEPVRFIEVRQPAGVDGQEDSSSAEVQAVVELVLEHAAERPSESLGVIAMGIKHAYRIEAQLARRRLERPELDDFFAAHPTERFFVKNLERVQGDERDAIILSIGYGKNRAGTLGLNFGPLTNAKMGHRRLNVAATRAKRRVTAVASFSAADMDLKRLNALGMKLTRLYLEYAAAGGNVLGDAGQQSVALNGFELSVMRSLEAAGLSLIPQYGAGSYRLDFAVQHPDRKGRFVMAIECDGATYHSANTARDRDRLRQDHLELLGWRFCRIWSSDWYRAREAEVKRVVDAYKAAVRAADAQDRGEAPETVAVAPSPPVELAPIIQLPQPTHSGLGVLGRPIHEYTRQQLTGLKAGIEADGQIRTKEELIREMSVRLGYLRLKSRIRERLTAIVEGRDVTPPQRAAASRRSYPPRRQRRW